MNNIYLLRKVIALCELMSLESHSLIDAEPFELLIRLGMQSPLRTEIE